MAYRIAQEALTNVARIALANLVNVGLKVEEGLLTLSAADNGQGFDPTRLSSEEGLGITSLRSSVPWRCWLGLRTKVGNIILALKPIFANIRNINECM